ncbi:MAG: diguanylate cyclase [bacterium]
MVSNSSREWVTLVDKESGLYNRLYLVHFLSEAFARARRYGGPLSCVLFRSAWWRGLEAIGEGGDPPAAAVRALGRLLLAEVREGDILGRWARDEFLLVASNTPPAGARACAENIFGKIEKFRPEGKLKGLSLSLRAGIAGLPGDQVRYAEDLPVLANERLLRAAREGEVLGAAESRGDAPESRQDAPEPRQET